MQIFKTVVMPIANTTCISQFQSPSFYLGLSELNFSNLTLKLVPAISMRADNPSIKPIVGVISKFLQSEPGVPRTNQLWHVLIHPDICSIFEGISFLSSILHEDILVTHSLIFKQQKSLLKRCLPKDEF